MDEPSGSGGLPEVSGAGGADAKADRQKLGPAPEVEGYEVKEALGAGGMGTVWRAVQLGTHREVALKLLGSSAFGSAKARARFEREVELASRLEHPHIARVYDSGLHHGVYYYAMELVEGLSLDRHIKDHGLSQRAVLALMAQICRAVQHAHQRGVIHRDLKPSNILVTHGGEPRVLDFGLAKALVSGETDLRVSMEGEIAGTPAYMSPEQARGRVGELDTRTDVYALGVMLYELLCGQLPHALEGGRYEVLKRIAEEEVRRPREIAPKLDGELEAVLLKALAREPDQRYATAGELADDLDNYLQGEPLAARKPTTVYFLRKRLRKYRVPVAIAAGVAVTLVCLTVYGYVRIMAERDRAVDAEQDALNQRNVATTAAAEAQNERDAARAAERESLRRAIKSSVSNGWQLFDRGDMGGALLWHVEALKLMGRSMTGNDADRRAEKNQRLRIAQVLRRVPVATAVLSHADTVTCAVFSADGQRIVTGSRDGTVRIWNAQTGEALTPPLDLNPPARVVTVAFRPDGRQVAAAGGVAVVRVWDSQTWETMSLVHEGRVRHVAFSPDAARILTVSDEGVGRIWLADSGEKAVEFRCPEPGVHWAAFSADGGRVLTAAGPRSSKNTVRVWSVADGRELCVAAQSSGVIFHAVFAPDSDLVAAAFADRVVQFHSVSGRTPLIQTLRHNDYVNRVAFSPDGKRVASASADNLVRVWDVGDGRLVAGPMEHADRVNEVTFSPDGHWILTASRDGTACVWDASTGKRLTSQLRHAGGGYSRLFQRGRAVLAHGRPRSDGPGLGCVPPSETRRPPSGDGPGRCQPELQPRRSVSPWRSAVSGGAVVVHLDGEAGRLSLPQVQHSNRRKQRGPRDTVQPGRPPPVDSRGGWHGEDVER